MSHIKNVPVVIVGGGPAGLTAAIYAARANLTPVVAAGSVKGGTEVPGGQLMITTEVENFPGFPEGIQGPELMEKFSEQAKKFGSVIIHEDATDYELKQGGPFKVKIGSEWYQCSVLILANGARAKWPGLPNEDKYINKGISACATCDGPLKVFRNKHLFVLGGGDSAVEEALFLTIHASKVTIVHRRDTLRASKIMQERAKNNPKIDFLWNSVITDYNGNDFLESIVVKNLLTGQLTTIPVGGLFMAIGHEPNTASLKGTSLELDEAGYIKIRNNVYTNIEGVFACGDVHDTYFRQAITAAGFGCMAAIAAERWLEHKKYQAKQ
eukprot:TRINITY_DN1099_c0_g2_i1.p1 TRINITY_DN1099_c0_g2~~TRINITY_DN1099_c0_g2_i1.p1  ORF type:complete len:347 (+),score=92.52 TRINITY_DN1099_c0_g2_i1:68-1042(+)